MSDLAYLTAYRILQEVENRRPAVCVQWCWQLKDSPTPLVLLDWTLEDQWQQKVLCSLHAEGHTFETALIRLAATFQETPEAEKLHLNTYLLNDPIFSAMVTLSDYDIRIEDMRSGKLSLSAYKDDRCLATSEGPDLQTAQLRLAQHLKDKPVRQLDAPDRFVRQWRFLESLSDLGWEEGFCLKTITNSQENGDVDPIFLFRNNQTRTFLRYDALNPAYVPRQCSATSFEKAVDAFAVSFGWEDH